MKHSTVAALALGSAFTFTALVISAGRLGHPSSVHAEDNPAQPAFYTEKVQPLLEANCYRCHGGINHRGGLNMTTREDLLKGGHHGPALVPGHPEASWMVKLIRHEGPADDPMNMPPAPKPKLADADIALIESWIKAGAVMPSSAPAAASAGSPLSGPEAIARQLSVTP